MSKPKPVFLRTQFPHNYDTNAAGDESGHFTPDNTPGAKQSFKDECDINVILKRFGVGYELPQGLKVPTYEDYTGINDFHTAMNAVRQAQENFDALPADVRQRFNDNPQEFLAFASNEANREALGEMGMLSKEGLERLRKAQDERKAKEDAEAAARHAQRLKNDAEQPPNVKN